MTNQNYHFELLVTGFGTMLAFGILALAALDLSLFPWEILASESNNILFALFLLPIIFTTGIVTDRFVDQFICRSFAEKVNRRHFPDDPTGYARARTIVYVKSEGLRQVFEQSRVRIRILRSWAFNSLLVGAASLFFIFAHPHAQPGSMEQRFCDFVEQNKWILAISVLAITAFSSYFSFSSWKRMTEAEAKNLKFQSEFLKDLEAKKLV